MALHPNSFSGQERLQPGARGEMFQADLPGYRNQGDRINRTNSKMNTNAHDVPNIKYDFDRRLPVLFRYGFAYGYNQIVIPKGRLVAVDSFLDLLDFDMRSQNNVMTLANGGVPVKLREQGDLYKDSSGNDVALVGVEAQNQQVHNVGTDWTPLIGMDAAYTDVSFRPFKGTAGTPAGPNSQLLKAGFSISEDTGKVVVDSTKVAADHVRPANIPTGILQRNEYTRNDDAYNGIMPGAILTDAMVEMPWFAYKNKAEQNPWGSAYGGLFPGALVKSDENGRFVPSPLSFPETEMGAMSILEYELERQQVIGQVYSVSQNLLPEGSAKWATWALSDRMKFNEFNPSEKRQNNRDGEDSINNSPYNSTGSYPGYPYDRTIAENDLHMLASTARGFSQRMNPEFQYENLGIPGLTDGKNAVVRDYQPETAGSIFAAGNADYQDIYLRTIEVDIEPASLQIKLGAEAFVPCTEGADINVGADSFVQVKYVNELQGLVVLTITDRTKADAYFANNPELIVKFQYKKRGLAGVPTFLDWDGIVGSVKILLTK